MMCNVINIGGHTYVSLKFNQFESDSYPETGSSSFYQISYFFCYVMLHTYFHVARTVCDWVYTTVLQSLQTEIENHEPRIRSLVETGENLIQEGHPQSEEFQALTEDLLNRWKALKDAVEQRKERLLLSDTAQQVCTRLLLIQFQ